MAFVVRVSIPYLGAWHPFPYLPPLCIPVTWSPPVVIAWGLGFRGFESEISAFIDYPHPSHNYLQYGTWPKLLFQNGHHGEEFPVRATVNISLMKGSLSVDGEPPLVV